MNKKLIFTALACIAIIGMQSCVSEEILPDGTKNPDAQTLKAVAFSSSIGDKAATRTAGNHWVHGDSVGIFMLGHQNNYDYEPALAPNKKYINEGGNIFKPATLDETIYYPDDQAEYPLKFIAYYPYKVAEYSYSGMDKLNFQYDYYYPIDVRNQNDTANIDILYSDNNKTTPVSGIQTVNLQFRHVLSKIIINVKHTEGTAIDVKNMTGVLNNIGTTGSFCLSNADITVKVHYFYPDQTVDLLGISKTAGYDTTFQAIIIPYDYIDHSSADLPQMQLLTDRLYAWETPRTKFESGKIYKYNLTLKGDNTVEFTGEIGDWDDTASPETPPSDLEQQPNGGVLKKMIPVGDALSVACILAGDFDMGDSDLHDNTTLHNVYISNGFLMTQGTITNKQYADFLNSMNGVVNATGGEYASLNLSAHWPDLPAGSYTLCFPSSDLTYDNGTDKWIATSGRDVYPVTNVTYYGALAYARWAGGDLPTEAQWEYAARAGSTTAYIGNNVDDTSLPAIYRSSYIYYAWQNSIGVYDNAWNLFHMTGNVWEWCKDKVDNPVPDYSPTAEMDPLSTTGDNAIIRGAAYNTTDSDELRLGYRGVAPLSGAGSYAENIGFRVVFPLKK